MPKHYNPHSQKPVSRLKQLRKMGNRELEAQMLLAGVKIWYNKFRLAGYWETAYGSDPVKRQCMIQSLFARWKGEEGADAGLTQDQQRILVRDAIILQKQSRVLWRGNNA